ncbi:MAG: hypothetical protein [Bacteriophage sp.]|nr:MAG: hypothetical protein [Bacteriophage sp.]
MKLPVKTIKLTETGEAVLQVNGKAAICPHVTRLIVPGNIQGTANISGATCGSHCALFDISEKGSGFLVGTCRTSMELMEAPAISQPETPIKDLLQYNFGD